MDGSAANTALNTVDYLVIGVLFLSAILAFARGFVREALSLVSWVGAAAAAFLAFPHIRPLARQSISFALLADGVALVGVFVLALMVLTLIGARLAEMIRGTALNAIDRSLGVFFGVARGAVLICVAYLFLIWLLPTGNAESQPAWLRDSRTRPMVEQGALWLRGFIPDQALAQAFERIDAARGQVQKDAEGEVLRRMSVPVPKGGDSAAAAAASTPPSGEPPPQAVPPATTTTTAVPVPAPAPVSPPAAAAAPAAAPVATATSPASAPAPAPATPAPATAKAGGHKSPPARDPAYKDRERTDMERLVTHQNQGQNQAQPPQNPNTPVPPRRERP